MLSILYRRSNYAENYSPVNIVNIKIPIFHTSFFLISEIEMSLHKNSGATNFKERLASAIFFNFVVCLRRISSICSMVVYL